MDELELKKKFAEQLLKFPNDAFKIALALMPEDTALALKAAHEWPKDAIVLSFQNSITENTDELEFLPSKAALARDVWDRAVATAHPENYEKLAKLYGQIMGYIEKQQTNVQINNNTDNRVMVIKDLGTNEQWETKAAEQQRKLLNVSTSKH